MVKHKFCCVNFTTVKKGMRKKLSVFHKREGKKTEQMFRIGQCPSPHGHCCHLLCSWTCSRSPYRSTGTVSGNEAQKPRSLLRAPSCPTSIRRASRIGKGSEGPFQSFRRTRGSRRRAGPVDTYLITHRTNSQMTASDGH